MRNYTDITVLVDRSGSMATIKEAMESGLAEFVQQHKANPSTRLTYITFDGENDQDVQFTAKPITEVGTLSLHPRGMTPLCDALCKAIDATGKRLSDMAEHKRPRRVLFVVITDGAENASRKFTRKDVQRRIEHQHGRYNWQFVYLGANQDAFKEAHLLGINPQFALNYTADAGHTKRAMHIATANTVSYASTGSLATFSTDDQDAATGGTH